MSWWVRLMFAGACLAALGAVWAYRVPTDGYEPHARSAADMADALRANLDVVARGIVDVEGGILNIVAARDGIVREVSVAEGRVVSQGDILAVLEDGGAFIAADITRAELAQADASMAVFSLRLAAAERETVRAAPRQIDAGGTRLQGNGASDQLLLARAELAERKSARDAVRARLAAAELGIENGFVRAPVGGTIIRSFTRVGDGVATANPTPMFWLAPATPLIVRADIEERFISDVAVGAAAEMMLESDEGRTFRARVTQVGHWVGPRRATLYEPRERADIRVMEAILVFVGGDPSILLGQRLLVRIARAPPRSAAAVPAQQPR